MFIRISLFFNPYPGKLSPPAVGSLPEVASGGDGKLTVCFLIGLKLSITSLGEPAGGGEFFCPPSPKKKHCSIIDPEIPSYPEQFIHPQGRKPQITAEGFQFLLKDVYAQIWTVLRQYLDEATVWEIKFPTDPQICCKKSIPKIQDSGRFNPDGKIKSLISFPSPLFPPKKCKRSREQSDLHPQGGAAPS